MSDRDITYRGAHTTESEARKQGESQKSSGPYQYRGASSGNKSGKDLETAIEEPKKGDHS